MAQSAPTDNDHPGGRLLHLIHLESRFRMYLSRDRFGGLPILLGHRYPNLLSRSFILRRFTLGQGYHLATPGAMFHCLLDGPVEKFVPKTS